MLFNSYEFVFLLLPAALIGYYSLNHFKRYQCALWYLFLISCVFVSYFNIQYLYVLLGNLIANFLIVRVMQKSERDGFRKCFLTAGIVLNIGLLFIFKYYDFFLETVNTVFHREFVLTELLLPLGISFYTFQQITYLVDSYRDKSLRHSFILYANYITFFPQFIQGPIVLQDEMIPQFLDTEKKSFDYDSFAKGLYVFSMGLGKKVLLADSLAKIVNGGYGNLMQLNSFSALVLTVAYTLQIYFDFCGYSDMAVGLGKMFRIELPWNFDSPYKAVSIDDFWDRWHTTLTRFFTKYVYFPLGGSRKGNIRTYVNIFLIFLLSGIWHGAAWTFIVWGILHGVVKMVKRMMTRHHIKIPVLLERVLTFVFVNFAWVYFRAPSIQDAHLLFKRLFTGGTGFLNSFMYETFNKMMEVSILFRADVWNLFENMEGIFAVIFVLVLIFACVYMKNTKEKCGKFHLTAGKLAATAGILLYSIFSFSGISEFIYFNF